MKTAEDFYYSEIRPVNNEPETFYNDDQVIKALEKYQRHILVDLIKYVNSLPSYESVIVRAKDDKLI